MAIIVPSYRNARDATVKTGRSGRKDVILPQGQGFGMAEIEPTTPRSSRNLTPLDAERWQTVPLVDGETEAESPPLRAPATLPRLQIAQSGRAIEVRTSQVCETRRLDPSLGLFPDLDLSQEGHEAIWVSVVTRAFSAMIGIATSRIWEAPIGRISTTSAWCLSSPTPSGMEMSSASAAS
jgi:hypothetical protein